MDRGEAAVCVELLGSAAGDGRPLDVGRARFQEITGDAGATFVMLGAPAGAAPRRWAAALISDWHVPPALPERVELGSSVVLAEPITARLKSASTGEAAGRIRCLVFSSAHPGRESEYQAWYSERHLHDVLDVPGYLAAQRFRVVARRGVAPEAGFLAIYEVDRDRYDVATAELAKRSGTPRMPVSPAVDLTMFVSAHFRPEVEHRRTRAGLDVRVNSTATQDAVPLSSNFREGGVP